MYQAMSWLRLEKPRTGCRQLMPLCRYSRVLVSCLTINSTTGLRGSVRQLKQGSSSRQAIFTRTSPSARMADDRYSKPIILGSGTRWTADQMNAEYAAQVREDHLKWAADNGITSVETSVIYA